MQERTPGEIPSITEQPLTPESHLFAPVPGNSSDTAALALVLCVFVALAWAMWAGVSTLISYSAPVVDEFFELLQVERTLTQLATSTSGETLSVPMRSSPRVASTSTPQNTPTQHDILPVLKYYTIQTSPPIGGSLFAHGSAPNSFYIRGQLDGDSIRLTWSKGEPGLREAYLVHRTTGKVYWLYGWVEHGVGNPLGETLVELPPFLPAGPYVIRGYPDVEPFGSYVESDGASSINITNEETGPLAFRVTREAESVYQGSTGIAIKIVINNPTIMQYPVRSLTVSLERHEARGQSTYSRVLYRSGTYTDTSPELTQAVFGLSVPRDLPPGTYDLRATLTRAPSVEAVAQNPKAQLEYSLLHKITVNALPQ